MLLRGNIVIDMRISSSDSINYCSLQIAETFTLIFRDISLSYIPWQVHAEKEIIGTILQLFPKTNECGNFRTMSVGYITAVSSSLGDKMWVAYSEI